MNVRWVGAAVGVTLVVAVPAASFAAPWNEPSSNASCVGTLSVFNQAHPEVFGTRSEVAHSVKAGATAEGIPPGAFYSFIAGAHGSVEQCP